MASSEAIGCCAAVVGISITAGRAGLETGSQIWRSAPHGFGNSHAPIQCNMRDSAHLIRLALVLAIGAVLFLVVRKAVIPPAFGQLGHYRPGALADNQKHVLKYAGQADCVLCHEDKDAERKKGRHVKIACEACHGPQAVHAADPGASKPVLPNATAICSNCHEKDASKPRWFPQVKTSEHSQGVDCNMCHKAHAPKL